MHWCRAYTHMNTDDDDDDIISLKTRVILWKREFWDARQREKEQKKTSISCSKENCMHCCFRLSSKIHIPVSIGDATH